MWRLPMLLTYAWNRLRLGGRRQRRPCRIKVRPMFIARDLAAGLICKMNTELGPELGIVPILPARKCCISLLHEKRSCARTKRCENLAGIVNAKTLPGNTWWSAVEIPFLDIESICQIYGLKKVIDILDFLPEYSWPALEGKPYILFRY